MGKNISDFMLGKAGEFRVMSELLLRGFNPAITCVDNGIDIILENGKKIQVKTASKAEKRNIDKNLQPRYIFGLVHSKKMNIKNNLYDFLICWGIPTNSFYIIPFSDIKQKWTLNITLEDKIFRVHNSKIKTFSKWAIYKDRWNLLK